MYFISICAATFFPPTNSHLEVSRDDSTTLDGRPVPLAEEPLLSIVLRRDVTGVGLRDSMELSFDQHAMSFLQCPNYTHLEFVCGTEEDVGDPEREVTFVGEPVETVLPSVPEVNALEDRPVGVPGRERLSES